MKLPLQLRLFKLLLSPFSNRTLSIIIAFHLLAFGYFIDSLNGITFYFSANAGLVTAIGLILTIKHHYLTNITSYEKLVHSELELAQCAPPPEEMFKERDLREKLLSRAIDEGVGVLLILIGTSINAYGDKITLVNFCTITS